MATGLRLRFFNDIASSTQSTATGMLIIPTANGANAAFMESINRQIQNAMQLGVKQGLWNPGDRVELPLSEYTGTRGHKTSGEMGLIGDRISGFVRGVPVLANQLIFPFEDIEVEMWPGVTPNGVKRVFAAMNVYLVPDGRLPV